MFFPNDPAKLFPLQVNEATGEPYMPLPSPHERIRITPARPSDAAPIQENLNDPRVYEYLAGPPFPCTYDDAIKWIGRVMDESGRLFWSMEEGAEWVNGCPVHCIREVQEDGTDIYIGDITIRREDPADAWVETGEKDNLTKAVGDPTIIWSIGDYLSPRFHRRGIMTTTLRTLIEAWYIPRMNCHKIQATTFVGNVASLGVLTKAGFKHTGDMEDAVRLPEGRGRILKSLHILKWERGE